MWLILNICLQTVLINPNKTMKQTNTTYPIKIQPVFIHNSKDSLGIRIAKKASQQMNSTGYLAFSANSNRNWQQSGNDYLQASFNYNPSLKINKSNYFIEQKLNINYGLRKSNNTRIEKTEDQFTYQVKLKLLGAHLKPLFKQQNKSNLQIGLKLNSQFSKTYKERFNPLNGLNLLPVSQFASPGYLNLQAAYSFQFLKYYEIALSISSIKFTSFLAQNYYTLWGKNELYKVKFKEYYLLEHGYSLSIDYQQNISNKITIKSENALFIHAQSPILLDLASNGEITYLLNSNFKLIFKHQLIYDRAIAEKAQWQNVFLLGYYF